jgi:hypothetical protein
MKGVQGMKRRRGLPRRGRDQRVDTGTEGVLGGFPQFPLTDSLSWLTDPGAARSRPTAPPFVFTPIRPFEIGRVCGCAVGCGFREAETSQKHQHEPRRWSS